MSSEEHRSLSHETPVRCAVVTVSDTRTVDTDRSGALIKARLAEGGYEVTRHDLVPDEPRRIEALLDALVGTVDAVLMNGGTGISRRDTTFEVVSRKLEAELPGFGELFRMLSYEEVGAAAMLSRAIAGVWGDTIVFSMPGSTNAVRLAMDRLIVPELAHLVWEIKRQR
jgi:molybdopterin adenylyltransferase